MSGGGHRNREVALELGSLARRRGSAQMRIGVGRMLEAVRCAGYDAACECRGVRRAGGSCLGKFLYSISDLKKRKEKATKRKGKNSKEKNIKE